MPSRELSSGLRTTNWATLHPELSYTLHLDWATLHAAISKYGTLHNRCFAIYELKCEHITLVYLLPLPMLHSQKKQQFGCIFIFYGSGSGSSFLIYKTVKNLFHFSLKTPKDHPKYTANMLKPVESSFRNVHISSTIETKFLKILDHYSICKVQGPGSTPNGFIMKKST